MPVKKKGSSRPVRSSTASRQSSGRRKTSVVEPTLGSMTLAEAIRAAYRGKLTQTELSEKVGVAQNTISRWSTGDVEPSLEQISALEKACGIPRGFVLRAAGFVKEAVSPEEAIAGDHRLDATRRQLLLSTYKVALRQSRGG